MSAEDEDKDFNHDTFDFKDCYAGTVKVYQHTGTTIYRSLLEFSDNSLSYNSTKVRLHLCGSKDVTFIETISICDNGDGMTLENLCNAWRVGIEKTRNATDIGKYHTGMKSAIYNLGQKSIILSKRKSGIMNALYLDIKRMIENDSPVPTDIWVNTNKKHLSKYLPTDLLNLFCSQESGTLIYIDNLENDKKQDGNDVKNKLVETLQKTYKTLPPACEISVQLNTDDAFIIKPLDLFYTNEPSSLYEKPYRTKLLVYRGTTSGSPEKVIECVTEPRVLKPRTLNNVVTNSIKLHAFELATCKTPLYLLHRNTKHGEHLRFGDSITQISNLPDKSLFLGEIDCLLVCLSKTTREAEKKKFTDKLHASGKGFYFLRDHVRIVGSALKCGKSITDRGKKGGADERSRMLVSYPSCLDKQVGCQYNKTIADEELCSTIIGDALFTIYKQVIGPWEDRAAEEVEQEKKELEKAQKKENDEKFGIITPFAFFPKTTEVTVENLTENETALEQQNTFSETDETIKEIPTIKSTSQSPTLVIKDDNTSDIVTSEMTLEQQNTFSEADETIKSTSQSPTLVIKDDNTSDTVTSEITSEIPNDLNIINDGFSHMDIALLSKSSSPVAKIIPNSTKKPQETIAIEINGKHIGTWECNEEQTQELITHIHLFFN